MTVTNHQTGELRFNVTADLKSGASSWLLRKDAENKGSKVSFYSREGSSTLGPRLVLEYGTTASGPSSYRDVASGENGDVLISLGAQMSTGLTSLNPLLGLGRLAYSSWALALSEESLGRRRVVSLLTWPQG